MGYYNIFILNHTTNPTTAASNYEPAQSDMSPLRVIFQNFEICAIGELKKVNNARRLTAQCRAKPDRILKE